MFEIGAYGYSVKCAIGCLPHAYAEMTRRARLYEDFGSKEADGDSVFVAVTRDGSDWPDIVVSLRCLIASGFYPGMHLIPENNLLLIGAGEHLLAYDLARSRKLWEDYTECGFWHWRRYADVVLMSAELELAAYSLKGERLWSQFVEPPWSYSISDGQLRLDVMGKPTQFRVDSGPRA